MDEEFDFSPNDFNDFCKKNSLTKKLGAKIVLERIEELSKKLEDLKKT